MVPNDEDQGLPTTPKRPDHWAEAGELVERDPTDPDVTFIQVRAEIHYGTISEYAKMMAEGVEFEPASALRDPEGHLFVWDGYHRGEAAKKVGQPLRIIVRPGSRCQAEWLAYTANHKHGLQRTHRDKRRVVELALKHSNGVNLSDREIGRHCGVNHKTVGRIRRELEATGEIPQSETRTVTKVDGTAYEMDTTNIGKSPATPASVDDLLTALCRWLISRTGFDDAAKIEMLEQIAAETTEGELLFELLFNDDNLPCPRRREDLRQACQQALARLNQMQQEVAAHRAAVQALVCYCCGQKSLEVSGHLTELHCTTCDERWFSLDHFEREAEEHRRAAIRCADCDTTTPGGAWRCDVTDEGTRIWLCVNCAPAEEAWPDEECRDHHYLKQTIVLRLPPIMRRASVDHLLAIDCLLDEIEEALPVEA